jgi:hypothetical protein
MGIQFDLPGTTLLSVSHHGLAKAFHVIEFIQMCKITPGFLTGRHFDPPTPS